LFGNFSSFSSAAGRTVFRVDVGKYVATLEGASDSKTRVLHSILR